MLLTKKIHYIRRKSFSTNFKFNLQSIKGTFFLWEYLGRSVLSESDGLLWKPRNLFLLEELRNLLFFARDFFLDYLTLEDGRDGLLRNFGKELALYAA
jgi:hypothetical protein